MTNRPIQDGIAAIGQHIPAPVILIVALAMLQIGSGWAKSIISVDNVFGLTVIRLALGGLFLTLFLRPKIMLSRAQWIDVVGLGFVFAAFNITVYLALIHLPLGLVATIGFLGPLAVSLTGARKPLDYFWPVLAFSGICLLAPLDGVGAVSWMAVGYGLAYALAWAFYILSSARVGRSLPGLDGFVIATCIAAVLVLPLGFSDIEYFFSTATLTKMAILIALFATVPFGLEFLALKRLPPRTFGILLSLEPAIATVTGMIILNEKLALISWVAIAIVSFASIGATMTRISQKPVERAQKI